MMNSILTFSFISETEWVLWEHKQADSKDPNQWGDNMSQVCGFNTVEKFWKYFNFIPTPSTIFFDGECKKRINDSKIVEEYSLFQKGIEPEWGDTANVTGGEFFCRLALDSDTVDLYWQNLVLAVVGGTLDQEITAGQKKKKSVVNGCRILDKARGYPMFKLEVWLSVRDHATKEIIKSKLLDIITDGQQQPAVAGGGASANRGKTAPKFEWKDHSA